MGDSTPITIRPAVPVEAGAVWQLTRDAYTPDRDRFHPPSGVFRETLDDVRRAMEEGTVYVAVHGAGIVGAVRVRPATNTHALYCGRLAVLPAAQRTGIGTALMRCVECHAREAGDLAVVLGVRLALPGNVAFFSALGYRVVGTESHPGYTIPTFAWMRKDLAR